MKGVRYDQATMLEAPDMPGAQEVIAWFGYWPAFHDAEVLSISMDRLRGSLIAIHVFEMTPEVENGYYVLAKHAIVRFCLEGFPGDKDGIVNTRIESFNHQNVLNGLSIQRLPQGYELMLEGIYGVDGSIVCEHMSVSLEPGAPPGRPTTGPSDTERKTDRQGNASSIDSRGLRQTLDRLVEKWCDRRALGALRCILQGYPVSGYPREKWEGLMSALKDVRVFGREEITSQELRSVEECLGMLEGAGYRSE